MNLKGREWFSAALLLVLLAVSAPGTARGEILTVEHNPASGNFATIQAAIDRAKTILAATPAASVTISVKADKIPYSEPFTPISNVSIIGDSTAGTFLSGGGAAAIINLNNVSVMDIRNFTFQNAAIGISVVNSSVNITNNVFKLGTAGTAIQVPQNSTGTRIVNNTFFNNGIAITANSDITISNSIFSTNTTAISTQIALTHLSYNDYFANAAAGVATLDAHSIATPFVTGANPLVASANPLFVNAAGGDFHLQSGSPCIGTGNPQYTNSFNTSSDMGAYGGLHSDLLLSPVTDLTATPSPTPSTILLNWSPTSNSKVTAYRIYFGTASRSYLGAQAGEASPFTVPVSSTSTSLTGLSLAPPPAPAAPVLTGITPLEQALQVSWTTVSGATGYRVYYSTSSFTAASLPATFVPINGGASASATIPGLTNGTPYFVAVAAQAQATIFAAVTAVVDSSIDPNFGSASDNESAYSSEASLGIGDVVQSAGISNLMSDFPEAATPFPNLKKEGCFIATAAYGFYSAPQVQALRDFRDRFLLTNEPGRAFVAWYYHYGPLGAHFINLHPWLKGPVRMALLPLIIAALVLTGSSPVAKGALLLLSALLLVLALKRKLPLLRRPALHRFTLTLFLLAMLPALARGAETRPDRPHWSLELKGGVSFPDAANWSTFYGSSYQGEYGAALAYKVVRQLEIGVEGSYLTASGKGQLPLHTAAGSQVLAGDVTLERVPLDVFVLARGIFSEDQLLVPYAAAGYTRLFYREDLKGQGTVKGSVNGYHARGGVQLLLDGLEPKTSKSLYQDWGVHHTYLFLEGKYLHAQADTLPSGSVNLGGTSCLGGFLFEF